MAAINVGLAGYGYSAKVYHLPFILSNPDLRLTAIYQRSGPPPAGSGKPHCTIDYPECTHYTTIDDFVADKNVELVVIATGDDVHADITIKALGSGKHGEYLLTSFLEIIQTDRLPVVCEKPLARTVEEANAMIEAQHRSGGKVLVPFQSMSFAPFLAWTKLTQPSDRRYDSDFRTVQSLVDRGVFGEISEFELHYDFDSPDFVRGLGDAKYTPGQGLFFMIGVHKLDQVLALFGPPATVTAFTRVLRTNGHGSDIEDAFTVILTYANSNLLVTVKCNTATKMLKPLAYLVRGDKGSFIKYGGDVQEDHIQAGIKPADPKYGLEDEGIWGELTTDAKVDQRQSQHGDLWIGMVESLRGSYALYYADVVTAIRGGEQVVKPITSLDGLLIIELARQSAKEGRSIPFPP